MPRREIRVRSVWPSPSALRHSRPSGSQYGPRSCHCLGSGRGQNARSRIDRLARARRRRVRRALRSYLELYVTDLCALLNHDAWVDALEAEVAGGIDACWCAFSRHDSAHALLASMSLFDTLSSPTAIALGLEPFHGRRIGQRVQELLGRLGGTPNARLSAMADTPTPSTPSPAAPSPQPNPSPMPNPAPHPNPGSNPNA